MWKGCTPLRKLLERFVRAIVQPEPTPYHDLIHDHACLRQTLVLEVPRSAEEISQLIIQLASGYGIHVWHDTTEREIGMRLGRITNLRTRSLAHLSITEWGEHCCRLAFFFDKAEESEAEAFEALAKLIVDRIRVGL